MLRSKVSCKAQAYPHATSVLQLMEKTERDLCLINEKLRAVHEPFCQYNFCTMHRVQNCVCSYVTPKRKSKLSYFPKVLNSQSIFCIWLMQKSSLVSNILPLPAHKICLKHWASCCKHETMKVATQGNTAKAFFLTVKTALFHKRMHVYRHEIEEKKMHWWQMGKEVKIILA